MCWSHGSVDSSCPSWSPSRERCSAYRALAIRVSARSLSLVGYDLIPIVAADTVADGMTGNFADYLSIVKHADRISAISRTSADGFRAFGRWRRPRAFGGQRSPRTRFLSKRRHLYPETIGAALEHSASVPGR